eukprot:513831-Amphidinium_carterae.1
MEVRLGDDQHRWERLWARTFEHGLCHGQCTLRTLPNTQSLYQVAQEPHFHIALDGCHMLASVSIVGILRLVR